VKCIGDRRANADKTLLHFSVSFAKWRYETLAVVLEALLKLRQICEEDMAIEWFENPQDREEINKVVVACKDKPLWRLFGALHTYIFRPLERYRRWGMVCGCQEHIQDRKEGKQISCPKDARRLREAWPKVQEMITHFNTKKRTLTPADVENDNDLHPKVRRLLTQASGYLRSRLKYVGVLPWYAVHCDEQAGAQEAIRQFESVPVADHDKYTQYFSRIWGKTFVLLLPGVLLVMHSPLKSVKWSG